MSRGRVSQIDSYEKLYEEVSRCENTRVFSGWLQCDCRPFKQALLNAIRRWGFMLKRHLTSHVLSRWALLPGRRGGKVRVEAGSRAPPSRVGLGDTPPGGEWTPWASWGPTH